MGIVMRQKSKTKIKTWQNINPYDLVFLIRKNFSCEFRSQQLNCQTVIWIEFSLGPNTIKNRLNFVEYWNIQTFLADLSTFRRYFWWRCFWSLKMLSRWWLETIKFDIFEMLIQVIILSCYKGMNQAKINNKFSIICFIKWKRK